MLEENNLLHCVERVLTQKGKRMSVYISNLKNAYIFLEEDKLRVRFEMKTGQVETFESDEQIYKSPLVELLTSSE